jgi:hypothetical protein
MTVTLDRSQRKVQLAGEDLDSLRLAYAQHVCRQQGATVDGNRLATIPISATSRGRQSRPGEIQTNCYILELHTIPNPR